MSITPASWLFLAITCVFLPAMAVRTSARVRKPGGIPIRTQYAISVFISLAITLFPALSAARYDGIELFPAPHFGLVNLATAAMFLLATLGTLPVSWNWKPEADKRSILWLVPHKTKDLWWWALVALGAGFVEEIVYRGVMMALFQRLLGSWWAAAAVCVAAFTLAHFVQGWRAMIVIALIATSAHWIVRMTGDLYTAMLVHFLYDFFAGLVILYMARREGLLQEVHSPPAPPSAPSRE